MIISLIAAIGKNRELGLNGKIPWYIPEDFKLFKKITSHHPIVMGRKTFESIGKALPNRKTIIITKNKNYSFKNKNVLISYSKDEALKLAKEHSNGKKEVFIVGGANIYQLFLKDASRLYLSIVEYYGKADTYFPYFNLDNWIISKEKKFSKNNKTPAWDFKLLNKKSS